MSNKSASRALVNLFSPVEECVGCSNSSLTNDEFKVCSEWLFKYYHKSGFLKDAHTIWLHKTSIDCLAGKGLDSIGCFIIRGELKIDIDGNCWKIHKSYLSNPPSEVDAWLQSPEIGNGTNDDANKIHVVHTAFIVQSNDCMKRSC